LFISPQRYNCFVTPGSHLPEFIRARAETIAWCAKQPLAVNFAESAILRYHRALVDDWRKGMKLLAPFEGQLRTPTLKPTLPSGDINTDADWKNAVTEVIAKRADLLGQRPLDTKDAAGRILLYIPSENLFDGAAMYSSKGFFDLNNNPPWDIWVYFSEQTLVSWVPRALEPLAQEGISTRTLKAVSAGRTKRQLDRRNQPIPLRIRIASENGGDPWACRSTALSSSAVHGALFRKQRDILGRAVRV
jgi:hypothetical protein